MWPRFRLTPDESKYNSKYENPNAKQHPVLRRFYYGEINTNPTVRQDQETFQIARRSRLFGLTASGDVDLIEIQITDITGEQFTTDFIPLVNLLCGYNVDPRGSILFNQTPPGYRNTGFMSQYLGGFTPLIFEPNIVLAPNQTISVAGRPIDPQVTQPLHVSLCFHVVEFPNMPGSPI